MKTYWSGIEIPASGTLAAVKTADVCVIGAGIAGMSAAYMLVKSGLSVIVLEARDIAGGETMRSTAHLSSALDDGFCHLENMYGTEKAKLAVQSHIDAIQKIEDIAALENIECDFKRLDGYLFNPAVDGIDLVSEMAAAKRLGLDVEIAGTLPFKTQTGMALRFFNQAVFHPIKYIKGLASVIGANHIHTSSRVLKIDKGTDFTVHTAEGKIIAKSVIVASHTPFIDDMVATKNMPYRSYVVCFRIPKGSFTDALYWNTASPYSHCRICPFNDSEDILMAGGEDHRTGLGGHNEDYDARFLRLENWAREHIADLGAVEYRWSGQVMEPVDSLAFIGRPQKDTYPGLYIVTGGSGHGLTHGTIAGMLLTDMIHGRANPWEKIYHPDRSLHKSYAEFIKHNFNYLQGLGRHLIPGENVDIDDIPAGEGAIVRDGMNQKAVYRDNNGKCHVFSATCPHMKGALNWNGFEKSWECRCHGSRFSATGDILNGPADQPMTRIDDEDA